MAGAGLVLVGQAYITNVSLDDGDGTIVAHAVAGNIRVPLAVSQQVRDDIDRSANDGWNTHRAAGFEATVDVAALRAQGAGCGRGRSV